LLKVWPCALQSRSGARPQTPGNPRRKPTETVQIAGPWLLCNFTRRFLARRRCSRAEDGKRLCPEPACAGWAKFALLLIAKTIRPDGQNVSGSSPKREGRFCHTARKGYTPSGLAPMGPARVRQATT